MIVIVVVVRVVRILRFVRLALNANMYCAAHMVDRDNTTKLPALMVVRMVLIVRTGRVLILSLILLSVANINDCCYLLD